MTHTPVPTPDPADTYMYSSFFEKLVEHLFLSELLQEAYLGRGWRVEVARSEVDASGFDLVLEANGVTRHVQLKSSRQAARTEGQNVHVNLLRKASGCVIWVFRSHDPERNRFDLEYRYFGGLPGEPLPSIEGFAQARAPGGAKKIRPNVRVIPKRHFDRLAGIGTVLDRLFGPVT